MEVTVADENEKYLANKGSIAVDGISLTISDVRSGSFFVCIIPHTLKNTTLGFKSSSDRVNVEFDMLIKNSIAHKKL